jgi:hypothetical protein
MKNKTSHTVRTVPKSNEKQNIPQSEQFQKSNDKQNIPVRTVPKSNEKQNIQHSQNSSKI